MSSRSSSMSQLPGNSNDIVPATDDKEQKLKTQKPKLRVAIPLPLMKFRKEPVLVSDPVVQKPALQIGKTSVPTLPSSQKDLELQKPPKFKLPAANKTAPQEAAAESSTSRTGKASVPTNLSVPEDLILQNPTEIKSCATDHTAPKKIIHSAKSSVETAIRGNKQPEVKNILLGSSLSTHPLFAENMSAWVPPYAPFCYNPYYPTPGQKEPQTRNPAGETSRASHPNVPTMAPMPSTFRPRNMGQFCPLDFSDCLFEVQLATGTYMLYLHSVALSQNKMFSRMIDQSREQVGFDDQEKIKIEKYSGVVGLSISAIADAIRTLYGTSPAKVLDRAYYAQRDSHKGNYPLTGHMVLITKFLLAGLFLEIHPVIEASFKAIREELNFDNVEFAMVFALHGTEYNSDHDPNDKEFHLKHLRGTYLELGTSFYGRFPAAILVDCLDFLVTEFPAPFFFNKNAPISPGLGGLVLGDNDPVSDLNPQQPRSGFGAIQFGSFHSTVQRNDRISTILISAPFAFLVQLYGRLYEQGRAFDLAKVLAARNSRYVGKRQAAKALQAEIRAKQVNGEGIPFELLTRSAMINRAMWHESRIFEGTGRIRPVRTYLGEANTPVANPELRVVHPQAPPAPHMGNGSAPGMGFNWADDVEG